MIRELPPQDLRRSIPPAETDAGITIRKWRWMPLASDTASDVRPSLLDLSRLSVMIA